MEAPEGRAPSAEQSAQAAGAGLNVAASTNARRGALCGDSVASSERAASSATAPLVGDKGVADFEQRADGGRDGCLSAFLTMPMGGVAMVVTPLLPVLEQIRMQSRAAMMAVQLQWPGLPSKSV